jgi:ribonuclease HII
MGSIIGVDEAGRGPVLGPLVVAAFRLESKADEGILKELNVRDSKKCSPKQRKFLASKIKKIGKFKIIKSSAHDIDEQRKLKTLNKLEGELFADAINGLFPEEDTTVIVDSADANEESFKNYISARINRNVKIISKHKADESYLVVAAASILAKTERDFQINKIGRELGFDIGSGYPADPITIRFLENWIKEKGDLPPHTRHSWNTSKKLLKNIKNPIKPLDQF